MTYWHVINNDDEINDGEAIKISSGYIIPDVTKCGSIITYEKDITEFREYRGYKYEYRNWQMSGDMTDRHYYSFLDPDLTNESLRCAFRTNYDSEDAIKLQIDSLIEDDYSERCIGEDSVKYKNVTYNIKLMHQRLKYNEHRGWILINDKPSGHYEFIRPDISSIVEAYKKYFNFKRCIKKLIFRQNCEIPYTNEWFYYNYIDTENIKFNEFLKALNNLKKHGNKSKQYWT